jgi:hypothetical protein
MLDRIGSSIQTFLDNNNFDGEWSLDKNQTNVGQGGQAKLNSFTNLPKPKLRLEIKNTFMLGTVGR